MVREDFSMHCDYLPRPLLRVGTSICFLGTARSSFTNYNSALELHRLPLDKIHLASARKNKYDENMLKKIRSEDRHSKTKGNNQTLALLPATLAGNQQYIIHIVSN